MKISKEAKKEIRSWALKYAKGYGYPAAPIVIIKGKSPPQWRGKSYCFKNKTGDIIKYPNAYSKAYGKPIYIPSTRRIIVGIEWVKQLELDVIQLKLYKENGRFINRKMVEFIFYFT